MAPKTRKSSSTERPKYKKRIKMVKRELAEQTDKDRKTSTHSARQSNKSLAQHGTQPQVPKALQSRLAMPLTKICSLKSATVPESSKVANQMDDLGNHRPVSLAFSIRPSGWNSWIIEHLDEQDTTGTNQHHFWKRKSCPSCLLQFLVGVSHTVDEWEPADRWYGLQNPSDRPLRGGY